MASTVVTLSADEAQLLRAFQKINQAQTKTDRAFGKNATEARTASGQISRDMIAAGDKSTQAWNASIRELRKMGPAGRAAAAEIEKHLRETGQAGRVSFAGVADELDKLDGKAGEIARNAKREFDKTAQSTSKAVGKDAMKDVIAFGAQWLTVGTAIATVSKAMRAVREEQVKSLESLMGQADPEIRLAQVATSGEDLDAMIAKADELSERFGLGRDQARRLMFSARSEGFEGDVDTMARASQVVDLDSQATLAGLLGVAFKNEDADTQQRLSAVLAAAGTSKFDFETVGKAVTKSATPAVNAGADMAETLAANAGLANVIGESAGDRIKAFTSKVALSPELQGKGIIGSVEALAAMDEESRTAFLGTSIELNEAYNALLGNMDNIREMAETVRADIAATEGGGGVLNQRIGIVEGSDRFQARMDVRRAEADREIESERRFAAEEASFEAGRNRRFAERTAAGDPALAVAAADMVSGAARAAGVGSDGAMAVGDAVSTAVEAQSDFAGRAFSNPENMRFGLSGMAMNFAQSFLGGSSDSVSAAPAVSTQESIQAPEPRGPAVQPQSTVDRRREEERDRKLEEQNRHLADIARNTAPKPQPVPQITGAALQGPVATAAAP